MNMVPLYSALLAQSHGAFASRKKKIEITMATFVYNMKMRNQMHSNNSWEVLVQQIGGVGMLWR